MRVSTSLANSCLFPVTFSGDVPVTTYVLQSGRNNLFAPDNLPAASAAALRASGVQLVPPDNLQATVRGASSAIGKPATVFFPYIDVDRWCRVQPERGGVPWRKVLRGQGTVPKQQDNWSCGINAAARFAAMQGQAIPNYEAFRITAPRYTPLPGVQIGGNAEMVCDYLSAQPCMRGTRVEAVTSPHAAPVLAAVDRALAMGRPAMVLLENSWDKLHWVTLVGRLGDNYVYLNSDGWLREVPGAVHGLIHRMHMDETAAQAFGFVKRFNCIVCPGEMSEKDSWNDLIDPTWYLEKYKDVSDLCEREGYHRKLGVAQEHFYRFGLNEGRQPCPDISFQSYLARYEDLRRAFGSDNWTAAAFHWVRHGRQEGRDASP